MVSGRDGLVKRYDDLVAVHGLSSWLLPGTALQARTACCAASPSVQDGV